MMADDSYSDRTRSSIALAAGTIVSHYRIISKIGVGGMGEVYLADDTELDRKVALKFLAPHLCQDEDCRTRFKREAQAAARLSHPNIITVFEVAEHQGRPFFAMEYIEGLSLRDYASRKELSIGQILEIGVQVCEGLQAAHEAGVTHRDIKPSNVVIDSRGRVRIVDFGLAAVKGATHVTKTGSTLGTVGYMSPEQVRGEDVDRRSDLFSLGVVFYEMITARAPFRKDSEAATMNAVLNDSPEPLSRFKSGVPADLERIVCRLLQKEKRLRYQTAGDLAADMKLVETSRRPLSAPFRTATRSSISRVGLPALVFVLFALILSGLKPWRLLTSPSEKAAAAPRRLAVLYLKNRGSPADEYLSYGITEDLTVDLTRIGTIGVAPMRSVMLYKDSAGELQDIARQLRVNLVLDGSLYKTGDIVRISAQLVDVTSGTNLWADRWEEKIENLPHIKEALAQSVSRALAVDTSVVRTAQIGSPETENAVAYDYYLRGKYAFEHKANEADVETAFGLFNKAVELEPMLLAARTGVAKVLMHKGQYEPAREQLTSILSDARRLGLRSDEAEVLRFLAFYHLLKSHWDEGQACAEQALRISGELGDLMGEVEALRFVIETHRIRGRFDEAFALFQRLLDLNRRLDDRAAEARSLGSMGNVYFEKGEYDSARDLYEQALVIGSECHDRSVEAYLRDGLGAMYFIQDDPERALQEYGRVLQMYTQLNEPQGMGEVLIHMARALSDQSSHDSALHLSARALEIFTQLGDHKGKANVLFNRGRTYAAIGDPDTALQNFNLALELYIALEDRYNTAATLGNLAGIYADREQYEQAVRHYDRASELFAELGRGREQAGMLSSMFNVYSSQDQYRQSLACARRAAAICKDIGEHDWQAGLQLAIGYTLTRLGHYDEAISTFLGLMPAGETPGDSASYARLVHGLGLAFLYKGEFENSRKHLLASLDVFEQLKDTPSVAEVNGHLGELFYSSNFADSARRRFETASGMADELEDRDIGIRASAYLAALKARAGERDGSIQQLRRLVAEAEDNDLWQAQLTAQRLLGQTLLAPRTDEASHADGRNNLQQALSLATQKEYAPEIERITTILQQQP